MTKRLPVALAALLLALLLPIGAGAASKPPPTPTPTPTDTPVPTATPYPTNTPEPTYTPYPSPTVTHRPALTLSATSGITGTTIRVDVSDFPSNTAVSLYWDREEHTLATNETDNGGAASLDVTIPQDARPGGHNIRAVGANHTSAAALFTVQQQGYQTPHSTQYCTGLWGWCPDLGGFFGAVVGVLGGVLNGVLVAIFSPIEHLFSDAFTALVAPFQKDLTYSPNLANDDGWTGLQRFQGALKILAGTLLAATVTVGLFARYLESTGRGDFSVLTSPLRRAVIVAGLILGYQPLMRDAFTVLNVVTSTINGIPLTVHETGWQAIKGAIFTLNTTFSVAGVLNLLIMVVALAVTILSVVVRYFGLGLLAALYVVGPLCLATWVSPYVEAIASWWVKTLISTMLWPVGYAVVLKIMAFTFAVHNAPAPVFGDLSAALAALGLVLLLYKTPAIVGGIVGGGGAALGAVASSVTDIGIGAAASGATSVFKKIPLIGSLLG